MTRNPDADIAAPFDYINLDELPPDTDCALTPVIFLPNRRLYHEPTPYCWCDPIVIDREDGYYDLVHHEQLN